MNLAATQHPDDFLRHYRSRLDGLVSEAIHDRVVVAVGCGAGSYMLEKLARVAPREIRLIDPDTVDLPNLARTAYCTRDLGQPKVAALAGRIAQVCPTVITRAEQQDVCALNQHHLEELFADADLIIAGTDHFPAQALLNRVSQRFCTPAVFIGIHERAEGGRIIWSEPGVTSCYRCVAPERYEEHDAQGVAGTNLDAAHGCLWDIQAIDMVALKVSVALLERGQPSALGRFHAAMAGRNEIVVRNSPEYEFGGRLWGAVLGDLPTSPRPYADEIRREALLAHDCLWLRTERHPDCPDCAAGHRKGGSPH